LRSNVEIFIEPVLQSAPLTLFPWLFASGRVRAKLTAQQPDRGGEDEFFQA
jgi:hypothetical protein